MLWETNKAAICWGVSMGAYSDYMVVAIYESKEDAEAYVAAHGKDDTSYDGYRVEEFTFYPAGIRPEVYTGWRAGWPKVAIRGQEPSDPIWTREETTEEKPPERPRVTEGPTFVSAWGADREACIKAVKDRVAARKALS